MHMLTAMSACFPRRFDAHQSDKTCCCPRESERATVFRWPRYVCCKRMRGIRLVAGIHSPIYKTVRRDTGSQQADQSPKSQVSCDQALVSSIVEASSASQVVSKTTMMPGGNKTFSFSIACSLSQTKRHNDGFGQLSSSQLAPFEVLDDPMDWVEFHEAVSSTITHHAARTGWKQAIAPNILMVGVRKRLSVSGQIECAKTDRIADRIQFSGPVLAR